MKFSNSSKLFTKRNSEFICENCGSLVQKSPSSSRDHCTACLYGKHVDYNPGDRLQRCGGLLKPIGLRQHEAKKQIVFMCVTCSERRFNIVANDDDYDEVVTLSQKPW